MKRTDIKILLSNCHHPIVVISPVGMEDTLVIDIEPICECGCSEEGSEGYDFTSEHCDYHGEKTSVTIIEAQLRFKGHLSVHKLFQNMWGAWNQSRQ